MTRLSASRTSGRGSPARKPDPAPSLDDIFEQIERASLEARTTPRPPGTVTVPDFMKKYGIKRDAAEERVRQMVRRGVLRKVATGQLPYFSAAGRMRVARMNFYEIVRK